MPKRSLKEKPAKHDIVAAIDLGSNSFHMTIAKVVDGGLLTLAKVKDRVRLAAGLDKGYLTEAAQQKALKTLTQFGLRLQAMPIQAVRAVGTNTLRVAKNSDAFLERAQDALGFPIDVIAGKEEARLIYSGVSHARTGKGKRLVIDIGGGSTELIIGSGFKPQLLNSLQMGCVAFERRFFPDGDISKQRFKACQTQCYVELQTIEKEYTALGWQHCFGSSGTILSVAQILAARGFDDGLITRARLQTLRDEIIAAGHVDKLNFDGLDDNRRAIFPSGLAILLSCFELLGVESMQAVDAALREGVLYELVGRFQQLDVRQRSIYGLMHRHHVDQQQAERVQATATKLFKPLAAALDDCNDCEAMLSWAALLHEIGMSISYGQHHKHGAYIIQHTDIDGFTQQEKAVLAFLVRAHRRSFPAEEVATLARGWRNPAKIMAVVLRIAALLHHRRCDNDQPRIKLTVNGSRWQLAISKRWLQQHALVATEIEQEAAHLKAAGIQLRLN